MRQAFLYLLVAIVADIVANVFLKISNRFKRKIYGIPALLLAMGAFSSLFEAIQTIDLSIAYAIWGGLGLLATTGLDYFCFGEKIRAKGCWGILLISSGVLLLLFF